MQRRNNPITVYIILSVIYSFHYYHHLSDRWEDCAYRALARLFALTNGVGYSCQEVYARAYSNLYPISVEIVYWTQRARRRAAFIWKDYHVIVRVLMAPSFVRGFDFIYCMDRFTRPLRNELVNNTKR